MCYAIRTMQWRSIVHVCSRSSQGGLRGWPAAHLQAQQGDSGPIPNLDQILRSCLGKIRENSRLCAGSHSLAQRVPSSAVSLIPRYTLIFVTNPCHCLSNSHGLLSAYDLRNGDLNRARRIVATTDARRVPDSFWRCLRATRSFRRVS